jgi:hypothetical protein
VYGVCCCLLHLKALAKIYNGLLASAAAATVIGSSSSMSPSESHSGRPSTSAARLLRNKRISGGVDVGGTHFSSEVPATSAIWLDRHSQAGEGGGGGRKSGAVRPATRRLKRAPATGLAGARSSDPDIVFFKKHTRQRQKQQTRPFFFLAVV